MPRHQPKVATEVPAESAEQAPVKRAARKPKAVAAEPIAAEPEAAPAPVKRARKPATEAQLANRKRFAEQVARCKQLRAADPKLSQKEAMAKAK